MKIYSVETLKQVVDDINNGKKFYAKQSISISEYFRDSIITDIESLIFYAGIHKKHLSLYRMLSKTFPYAIYYDINNNIALVYAVLDIRQNPSKIYQYLNNRTN